MTARLLVSSGRVFEASVRRRVQCSLSQPLGLLTNLKLLRGLMGPREINRRSFQVPALWCCGACGAGCHCARFVKSGKLLESRTPDPMKWTRNSTLPGLSFRSVVPCEALGAASSRFYGSVLWTHTHGHGLQQLKHASRFAVKFQAADEAGRSINAPLIHGASPLELSACTGPTVRPGQLTPMLPPTDTARRKPSGCLTDTQVDMLDGRPSWLR
ncbi:hypothetical protein N657DRAFT_310865 [Parathielavia appendiculata]|uniref:Uncharacterized protein n=1 Tax=Parathielavia appendiculata TaxID=2587402 RepID=A0AAN6Z5J6_9PEZI|nr:hypothetical protein N657DRAFT_310865 [Parathielavia appendiculata]